MRKQGKVKEKSRAITTILAQNPTATLTEIANKAGMPMSTTSLYVKAIENNGSKDHGIIALTNTDLDIVIKAQDIILKKLNDPEQVKRARIQDISAVARDSTARYSLFRGNATDEKGGLKDIKSMNDDELAEYILTFKRVK